MVETILIGAIFGMAGFLVAAVLTREGEVLSWWPRLVNRLLRVKNNDYNSIQTFFIKLAYGCSKCVAGQLSLWFFILSGDFSHAAAGVVVAIFSAYAIEKKYE